MYESWYVVVTCISEFLDSSRLVSAVKVKPPPRSDLSLIALQIADNMSLTSISTRLNASDHPQL